MEEVTPSRAVKGVCREDVSIEGSARDGPEKFLNIYSVNIIYWYTMWIMKEDVLRKLIVSSSNSTLLLLGCILVILFNLSEPRFSNLNKNMICPMRK